MQSLRHSQAVVAMSSVTEIVNVKLRLKNYILDGTLLFDLNYITKHRQFSTIMS